MATDLTLITCTGDRPHAFSLCERYMALQDKKDFAWIVVDDGTDPTQCTMGQEYVRLEPNATHPRLSFRRNMLEALDRVRTDKVMFIEDDDCYHHPEYLEAWSQLLDRFWIVGEARAPYYNIQHNMSKVHSNKRHASLCQTGISGCAMKDKAKRYLENSPNPETLDGGLWKRSQVGESKKYLLPVSLHVVGIKGFPGRGGLGVGHWDKDTLLSHGYTEDPDWQRLTEWIGSDFTDTYKQMKEMHATV